MGIERSPLPLLGGVNLHEDPLAIPEGQWQRLRNLCARRPGVLGVRPSLTYARDLVPDSREWDVRLYAETQNAGAYHRWAQYLRPVRFLFDPNYGECSLVAVTTDNLLCYDAIAGVNKTLPYGTFVFMNLPQMLSNSGGEPIITVAVLGEVNRQPSLFVFNGTTYVFNGANNGFHLTAPAPGFVIHNEADYVLNDFGAANANFNPDGAAVVRDRVVYFKGSWLYFSDRNEPLTISVAPASAADTRGIFLGGEELENITAVADLSTSADGSPVQSVVAAWTNTHMYMLLGEPTETTDPGADANGPKGSLQINKLNIQAGCVSQATVTRTPYGTFWLGANDVWFMPWGSLPIRVGTSIRPLIEAQPPGLRWKLHAEFSDDHYKLALFSEGQGPGLLDPCSTHMWLNLHDGAPRNAEEAKWFGPQEFVQTDAPNTSGGPAGPGGTWCMARDTRGIGDGRLYALQSYIVPGGDLDPVLGMSLCSLETFDGKDTTAPQAAISDPWQANYGYYEGHVFVPTPRADDAGGTIALASPIWVCTTTGTSGGTEPDWLATTGTGSITDGTAVWKLRYWDGADPMSAYVPNLEQGDNQIEWSMLSREFAMGDPMVEKLLDGAEIGYVAAAPTQLTYNSHPKQDEASKVLTPNQGQTADNTTGSWTGDRVWQARQLSVSPTKRFHGYSAMWECRQDAGIVITTGVNDTLVVQWDTPITYTLTVPAGYYADLAALLIALEAQSAAGIGVQSTVTVDGSYARPLVGLRQNAGGTVIIDTTTKLAQLLGYSRHQGSSVTSGLGTFVFGYEPPNTKVAPDMQLSAINLRHRNFGRRPT